MEKVKGTIRIRSRSRSRTVWMLLDGVCLSEPEFLHNHRTTCKGRIPDRSVCVSRRFGQGPWGAVERSQSTAARKSKAKPG